MSNGTLVLIRGIPGSGKTTHARHLVKSLGRFDHLDYMDKPNVVHFEADMFFCRNPGNEYKFDPSKLKDAHGWCQESAENAMKQGINHVIISNTFVKRWEMQKYLDLAREYGYDVQEVTVKGPWKSVHGVPEHAIERMKKNWEE